MHHDRDSAADAAKRLKEKAQEADHEARQLRVQANSKYDASNELSRQVAIFPSMSMRA